MRFTRAHIRRRLNKLESRIIDYLISSWRIEQKRMLNTRHQMSLRPAFNTRANDRARAAAISALTEGYPGVVLCRLSPKPILDPRAALKQLQALNPSGKESEITPGVPQNKQIITPQTALKILRRLFILWALWPSGLRLSHFQPLLSEVTDGKPMSQVMTIIANGVGPKWLRNARLIEIAKQRWSPPHCNQKGC